jgi:hypothetical protein
MGSYEHGFFEPLDSITGKEFADQLNNLLKKEYAPWN